MKQDCKYLGAVRWIDQYVSTANVCILLGVM